ncbi:hypothetical protein [Nannocystis punicea]|uniref:DUF2993 domain-containing protein n=1 Tax=Nannocystis punicea TaxID=2995304 RepID=A0ABY7H935_9BACT|nr:hypothetical protein [Nannocystis poenicansa]WAS95746.1 hypothetical protein O0S08_06250 [Nannocystis poenicansa]
MLFRQDHAEVKIADSWQKRALGPGFDASHEACEGFDAGEIPNELGKVHDTLHVRREDSGRPGSDWIEVSTLADGLEVALLANSVGANLKVQPPADLPLEVGMKFRSDVTKLSLARVARRLDLSSQARKCIEATLCRPLNDERVPATVRYVERLYYGNLVRLDFGEQVFTLKNKGTIEGATATFSVKATRVRLNGTILGRIDSSRAKPFDLPQMVDLLADRNILTIQNEIAARSVNHEIVGYRFAEVDCRD